MSNLTDEDYKRIAAELLAHGLDITSIPATTETEGIISLPAVRNGELVNVDLTKLLSVISAATTEARNATSAALKAKTDAAEAAAAANDAATGAANVISEHSVTALRALLGATAFFDEIIEDVTIQPANPTNEEGGHVVYVRAKKQFAFKILQGAITRYYANWSKETLYHEYDSYAIAKNKIYVNANELFVWDEQLQDIKKVSTEAVVQLVQEISDDATKAPSSAAVSTAITSINQKLETKVDKNSLVTINGHQLIGQKNLEIAGEKSPILSNITETNSVMGKVFFDKEISVSGDMLDKKNVNCTDFIELTAKHKVLLTSHAGQVKGAFYDLGRKFIETFNKSGAISDYQLQFPAAAKFFRANLARASFMQGVDKIEDIDNENIEGELTSVKNFLSLTYKLKKGFIMADGSINLNFGDVEAIAVYQVANYTEVFLNGSVKLAADTALLWIKNSSGDNIETITRNSATEIFNNTRIVLPEGATEIWAFKTIKISVAKSQSLINDDLSAKIEDVKNSNETLQKEISESQKSIVNIDDRVKKIETANPSSPTPTPTQNILNPWKGKKIVWIGASAPKGQTEERDPEFVNGTFLKRPYPVMVAELLQCKVVNASISGIGVEAVWNGAQWIARKGGSISLSFAEYNNSKQGFYSYEGILKGNEDADLFVFDIEPNNTSLEDITHLFNFANWTWERDEGEDPAEYDEKWKGWDASKGEIKDFAAHRDSYQGALIYVIDKIYEKIPTARICFVSEAEFFSREKWDTEQPATTATKQLAKKMHAVDIDLLAKSNFVGKNKDILYNSDGHPKNELHKIYAKILANELIRIA